MDSRPPTAAERFAIAATAYCAWAEGEPLDSHSDARAARMLCAELFRRAIDLPLIFADVAGCKEHNEDRRSVYHRLASLPVNMYSTCSDVLLVSPDLPTVGNLADDLADTWLDVRNGLEVCESGYPSAATWHWRFYFDTHWGRHLTSALHVLQTWLGANDDDAEM
jgi:hypothetical protein